MGLILDIDADYFHCIFSMLQTQRIFHRMLIGLWKQHPHAEDEGGCWIWLESELKSLLNLTHVNGTRNWNHTCSFCQKWVQKEWEIFTLKIRTEICSKICTLCAVWTLILLLPSASKLHLNGDWENCRLSGLEMSSKLGFGPNFRKIWFATNSNFLRSIVGYWGQTS